MHHAHNRIIINTIQHMCIQRLNEKGLSDKRLVPVQDGSIFVGKLTAYGDEFNRERILEFWDSFAVL